MSRRMPGSRRARPEQEEKVSSRFSPWRNLDVDSLSPGLGNNAGQLDVADRSWGEEHEPELDYFTRLYSVSCQEQEVSSNSLYLIKHSSISWVCLKLQNTAELSLQGKQRREMRCQRRETRSPPAEATRPVRTYCRMNIPTDLYWTRL